MSDNSHEWDSEEWLSNAKSLINWVAGTSEDSRIFVLVRHSHRETIEDHSTMASQGLTNLGVRMSTEFGRRLPATRLNHIYFSFVSRCYQTAEEIGTGLKDNEGAIEDFDTLPILATPTVNDNAFWDGLQPDGRNITDFVNNWEAGTYINLVEEFHIYRERLLADTLKRLKSKPSGSMDIHVTHDLALMSAKRILLDRPLESPDREAYLGGIGIELTNEKTLLYSGGSVSTLDHIY